MFGYWIAAALLLAGLATAPRPAAAAEPYEIHAILSLTGGASFLGKAEQQSIQLIEKWANANGGIQGRPIRFVFHDDQSSPQVAVQLASQVVALKPSVQIGPNLVAMCNAAGALMKDGPVMYCLSPGIHPPAGSYIFTSSVSTVDLSKALIRYFRLRGWTNIAVMTSTDASGQDAERGIKGNLALPENKDVKVVAQEHFAPTDVSVAAQIEKIKAAKPQAMIAWSTGSPAGTIFKAIAQAGLDIPVGTTDGNMTHAQMTQYAAFLPKQLYIPAAEWVMHGSSFKREPAVEKAQALFEETFKAGGVEPDVASALAWDPTMVLIDALRKLGPTATAIQVRDHLSKLKGYAGVDGIYDYQQVPQRGLNVNNAVVTLWNPEKKNWIPVSAPAGTPLGH